MTDKNINQSNNKGDGATEKRSKLKKMEPKVFDGDILEFPRWLNSFEALIEEETSSNKQRLYFLGHYTTGEAHDAIKSYLGLKNSDTYQRAKQIMVDKFGDHIKLAEKYKQKLREWPSMKRSDPVALTRYSEYLWQCHDAIETVGYLDSLNNADENVKMARKLPTFIADRWNRVVQKWRYKSELKGAGFEDAKAYPPFENFCTFVTEEARIADGPCNFHQETEVNAAPKDQKFKRPKASVFSTSLSSAGKENVGGGDTVSFVPKCLHCRSDHFVSECTQFLAKCYEDKRAFAMKHGLCFGCLRRRHTVRDCRWKNPALLGAPADAQPVKKSSFKITIEEETADSETTLHSTIVPVTMRHRDNPDILVKTYAVLDTMSNCCLVKPGLIDQLKVPRTFVDLELTTMGPDETFRSSVVFGLTVKGVTGDVEINLPQCYTKERMPVGRDVIPKRSLVKEWPHLREVAELIPEYDEDLDIGMLIGYNCPAALTTNAWRRGESDSHPVGIRTPLGWSVMGAVAGGNIDPKKKTCLRTAVREIETAQREISPDQLKNLFDLDFGGPEEGKTVSQEDVRFMEIVEAQVRIEEDGHYSLPLPFKTDGVTLPNNRLLAEKKFYGLRKRLSKDEDFKGQYMQFMSNIIEKGYAERAPPLTEERLSSGRVYYASHHGVKHPKKPGKVRGVFNYSERFKDRSLNDELLTGPDYLNSLPGILCRFREEPVAVQCDIEAMFYQVRVHEEDRDFLRFLWVEGEDLHGPLVEYRMKVHPFGAASSPGCANFTLRKVAEDHEEEYGSEIVNFVKRDFYMDDGLRAKENQRKALQLIEGSYGVCAKGGFLLHKFLSNDQDVLDAIPAPLRAKAAQNVEFQLTGDFIERSLGMDWFLQDDEFRFRIQLTTKPLTRRNLLSCVSSIFDPMGFLAPIILNGKRIIQQLCQDGRGWDEPVSEEIRDLWNNWRHDLENLEIIKVARCFKESLREVTRVELHHFSDASSYGFGQCSYIRLMDGEGGWCCNLAMAKAKVGPSKQVTILRLELQSAVLSTRVAAFLNREFSYQAIDNYYWTDSMITLGYITNRAKRFHIYVANRIQQIQDVSRPSQWRHVATEENPADLASRGASVEELAQSSLWWHGPAFLNQEILEFNQPVLEPLSDEDPEIRPQKKMILMTGAERKENVSRTFLSEAVARCSSWYKLLRLLSYWLKYRNALLHKIRGQSGEEEPVMQITVVEKYQVTQPLVKIAQREELEEEYELLSEYTDYPQARSSARQRNSKVRPHSNLYRLDPYMDERGVLRVGGRIRRADLPKDLLHPCLLPRRHAVTGLILTYTHDKAAHAGRGSTLSNVRSTGYWLLGGRATVAHYLKDCVFCKKMRAEPQAPKMADLPADRLTPAPPFSYCGMDVFGPYDIKVGRVNRKRWIIIFTCLVMRGAHLEILHHLTTDSFINAYRRFIARRGPVRVLRSDRGTNFVGAKNELEKALKEINFDRVRKELTELNCDFVDFQFNPPQASHMGGVWERLVGAGKRALNYLMVNHSERLDEELFLTVTIEAEALLNNRKLTYLDVTSVNGDEPLTPQMLLTLKSKAILPLPGNFVKEDLYCRRRWRCVQYLANQFWYRWQREYLPTLNQRKKWQEANENLREDDLVLMVDDNTPRSQWNTGRVTEAIASQDGHVRRVRVKTSSAVYERPVHRLILLYRVHTE